MNEKRWIGNVLDCGAILTIDIFGNGGILIKVLEKSGWEIGRFHLYIKTIQKNVKSCSDNVVACLEVNGYGGVKQK